MTSGQSEQAIGRCLQLGKFRFKLKSENTADRNSLERLFQPGGESYEPDAVLLDLDKPRTGDSQFSLALSHDISETVRSIIAISVNAHTGCLWLHGTLLQDERQQTILLAGKAHAGKTTVTLALAYLFGYKIVADDFVLIDLENEAVVPFAAPARIREGTRALINELAKREVIKASDEPWMPLVPLMSNQDCPAKFNAIFYLSYINSQVVNPVSQSAISVSDFLRMMARNSNLLKTNSLDRAVRLFNGCSAYTIEGGGLRDRVELIDRLTSHT